jgi:hypothetical protein
MSQSNLHHRHLPLRAEPFHAAVLAMAVQVTGG